MDTKAILAGLEEVRQIVAGEREPARVTVIDNDRAALLSQVVEVKAECAELIQRIQGRLDAPKDVGEFQSAGADMKKAYRVYSILSDLQNKLNGF